MSASNSKTPVEALENEGLDFLNHANIAMSSSDVEYHPLRPFVPGNARVLFLGSFPPQRKRWCMDFYYPNFINDHWRIEGLIFFGDKRYFEEQGKKSFSLSRIVSFLRDKGIAINDTATAIKRLKDNASDKFLEVVSPTDIVGLLARMPICKAVATTGQKATDTICAQLGILSQPKVGTHVTVQVDVCGTSRPIALYRLPSSSRAYPMSLEKKTEAYRRMFAELGIEGA